MTKKSKDKNEIKKWSRNQNGNPKSEDHWCLSFFSHQVELHPHPFCFLFTSCKNLHQMKKDVKTKIMNTKKKKKIGWKG